MASQSSQIHQSSSDFYVAVTPHDTTNFTDGICRGIYVGVSGNIVAIRKDGIAITFTAVAAGTILPIRAIRINSTSTTATNMVAIY